MPLCRRRIDEEGKVDCGMHVRVDARDVLDESVARPGEMGEARF
jgi:hypothetical protein